MDHAEATDLLLDAAGKLFYERGVQAVGMDAIRAESGVSLKRLYQCFPSKDTLVEAYLRRRDTRWRDSLTGYVAARDDDPLAVFDWLHDWFREPGFRGCAFVNSFGELGPTAPGVTAAVRAHKAAVRVYLRTLTTPETLADQLFALLEGATVTAAISGDPAIALTSKAAARALLAEAAGPSLSNRQEGPQPTGE
ncbi:TetR/AcrR family transcriptional regulator [Amycolatopsis cihanbeyliensis]|uniref:TetR family transcriptional regulator n=1 Tax=Amycolatopsis cihanbeyliensis TaxID=1128664 RepID=A0A542CUG4_AMYCI|nr:TetR/AcrR family transcriptional regulator [Amycolatopsis cihanbeyliensis]TQI94466.1 TetR family transcriptional regulator [Amycolatopsis cihanbeyliensis]